jgi:lipoprotein NlpI
VLRLSLLRRAHDRKALSSRRAGLEEAWSEANFFGGELALQQCRKDEAGRLFRLASKDCPKNFILYAAADAELKALGAKP